MHCGFLAPTCQRRSPSPPTCQSRTPGAQRFYLRGLRSSRRPNPPPSLPPRKRSFQRIPSPAVLPVAVPEIEYQAAAEPHEPMPYEPRAAMPPGLITGHDPDAMSAMERTRSAVWPLVLALVVGIAIGFAGGFFAGSREQPSTVAAVAPTAVAPTPTPAGTPASATAPPPPNSEQRTQNSELKTQNSEPKNLKSETSNLKSPPPPSEGRLVVRSHPAGARVSVDGKDYGVTPATVRDLAERRAPRQGHPRWLRAPGAARRHQRIAAVADDDDRARPGAPRRHGARAARRARRLAIDRRARRRFPSDRRQGLPG